MVAAYRVLFPYTETEVSGKLMATRDPRRGFFHPRDRLRSRHLFKINGTGVRAGVPENETRPDFFLHQQFSQFRIKIDYPFLT